MGRRCSHCGHNGHNSRTCSSTRCAVGGGGGGLRLFGVQLPMTSYPMKKSFSMDCMSSCYTASSSPSSSSSSLVSIDEHNEKINGYLSEGLMGRTPERKKGVPWTEEEHRLFLAGLERLGKGDWRGISRNFVITRTPTQVASHAQKYFIRQNCFDKKRRRSSLFDVVGSCGRGIHDSKFEDTTVREVPSHMKIYPNSSEEETNLPSCLHLMPNSSSSPVSWSPSLVESPQAHPPLLDLELSISTSRSSDQNKSSPGSLLFERIRVSRVL